MQIEIISIRLVSTGYVEKNIILIDEFKSSFKKVLPYTLLTLISTLLVFMGMTFFIIPGIAANLYFNLVKVDFSVSNGKLKDSVFAAFKMLKDGIFIKTLKIYLVPAVLQFLVALITNVEINPATIEQDLLKIYPYLVIALIILYPVTVCLKTAIYYNIIKERMTLLEPAN